MPLKDLKKLIALCRAQGVTSIKMEGVELQLGPVPTKQVRTRSSLPTLDPGQIPSPTWKPGDVIEQSQIEHIETDMLEGDDLLFYSATGAQ